MQFEQALISFAQAPLSPLLRILRPRLARHVIAHAAITLDLTKHIVKRWGCVLKISPSGEILDVLMDPNGEAASTVSAVTEHGGQLFMGNLQGDYVSAYRL